MKRLLRLFAVAIALSGTSAFADDFTSNVSSLWSLPGTWTNTTPGGTGTVPNGASDNVTLNSIVTLDSSRTIGDFTGLNSRALSGGPAFDLTIQGTATIADGIDFRFSNSGNIITNGVFNWGSHRDTSTITSEFTMNGTTNYTVSGAQDSNNLWTNTGTFNRSGGGNGSLLMAAVSPSFVNTGTFNKTDADTFSITGNTFQNSGDINVSGGTLSISNFQHDSGTITVSNGATFAANVDVTAGSLEGIGNVTGNVSLAAGTSLGAGTTGTAIGTLAITGDLSLNDATTLSLDLGAGGTNDLISVGGNATINDAELVVTLGPGFTANVGDTFEFLTSGGASGTFGGISFAPGTHPDWEGVVDVVGNNYSFRITAVPEPSSLAVLGLVSVGAIARRRRRA